MQRLAALVPRPRPRVNLIRLHGVLAPNAKLRSEIVPGGPVSVNETSDDLEDTPHHAASARMSWARLLKRVFDIDIEHCPHCGGNMKIIAAIENPSVIAKLLSHLGLPTRAPPRAPARSFAFFEPATAPRQLLLHCSTTLHPCRHALLLVPTCRQRPDFKPTRRFSSAQLPSRHPPMAAAGSTPQNSSHLLV